MKELIRQLYVACFNEEPIKYIEKECPIPPVPQKTNREKLYETALTFIGKDASPKDAAPDEYGCMETVDSIHKACFGEYINPAKLSLSTTETYKYLLSSQGFVEPSEPMFGDIIISPTGYGNGGLSNGHVGILGKSNIIMSNNSDSGKWEENFTTTTWRSRYVGKGGFPVKYFRKIN
jgi:hypothetical protein